MFAPSILTKIWPIFCFRCRVNFQAEIEQGGVVCLFCVLLMNRTNEPVDNLFVNVFVSFITTESSVLFITWIWSDCKNSGSLWKLSWKLVLGYLKHYHKLNNYFSRLSFGNFIIQDFLQFWVPVNVFFSDQAFHCFHLKVLRTELNKPGKDEKNFSDKKVKTRLIMQQGFDGKILSSIFHFII